MITNNSLSTAVRSALDFAMGVAVFVFVAGCVAQGHGTALAGANLYSQVDTGPWGAWLTTVAFAHGQSGIGWHPLTRDAAIILLAVSFGAITAFNLAIVRHLKAVVDPAAAAVTLPRLLTGPHINA